MPSPTALPLPPWQVYPGAEPTWGGWRQGSSEAWLHQVWLPFWRGLDAPGREAYLSHHPPPDEDWRTQLLVFWA